MLDIWDVWGDGEGAYLLKMALLLYETVQGLPPLCVGQTKRPVKLPSYCDN